MFPYRTIIEWSGEDECFVARAPAFGALAAHGDSQEEAAHELGVAGAAMIEVMKEMGRPIPAPDAAVADYAGKIALRVPRSVHARLAELAELEGVSLNQVLVGLISEGLARTGWGSVSAEVKVKSRMAAARAMKVAQVKGKKPLIRFYANKLRAAAEAQPKRRPESGARVIEGKARVEERSK